MEKATVEPESFEDKHCVQRCKEIVENLHLDETDYFFVREAAMVAHGVIEDSSERIELVAPGFNAERVEEGWTVNPVTTGQYFVIHAGYWVVPSDGTRSIYIDSISTSGGLYGPNERNFKELVTEIDGINYLNLNEVLRGEKICWTSVNQSSERARNNIKAIRRKRFANKIKGLLRLRF